MVMSVEVKEECEILNSRKIIFISERKILLFSERKVTKFFRVKGNYLHLE